MSKNNKSINNHKKKAARTKILLICIPAVILLGAFGFWFNHYLAERKTLSELSVAGRNLEAVYNNLLASSPGNIAGSYFYYDCSVSHSSWLTERISCGPHGDVALKEASTSIEEGAKILAQSTEGTIFKEVSQDVTIDADSAEISTQVAGSGISCHISYGENSYDSTWAYSLVCRKNVADFLPGYAIEK